jgi:benzoate membrane transport protein
MCFIAAAPWSIDDLVTRSPPILIEAVAGLALVGTFASALLGAVGEKEKRLPAALTFLVTASGLLLFGIGAAFWGLVVGLLAAAVERWTPRKN